MSYPQWQTGIEKPRKTTLVLLTYAVHQSCQSDSVETLFATLAAYTVRQRVWQGYGVALGSIAALPRGACDHS